LHSSLTDHLEKHGSQTVANVRALSFNFPQLETMRDTASSWRELVHQSTGERYLRATTLPTPLDELNLLGIADFISSSSEDEDDDDWANEMDDFVPQRSESINPIISPFIREDLGSLTPKSAALTLTRENVDKILEEVRPYLISDGGNVSVRRVDEGNGDVYLKLEGACGSCSSSTITMKMGIERLVYCYYLSYRRIHTSLLIV
jgi:Fe-S cluster biogenesis protein NfuA